METICEEIRDDMHKIEEDSKKIDCYAILDLIVHSLNVLSILLNAALFYKSIITINFLMIYYIYNEMD